jgi:hypothetical protein
MMRGGMLWISCFRQSSARYSAVCQLNLGCGLRATSGGARVIVPDIKVALFCLATLHLCTMPQRSDPPLDREATWATIRQTLDHLFTFPEDVTHAAPAPSLTPGEWSAAYTAVYAWTRAEAFVEHGVLKRSLRGLTPELYQRTTQYLQALCRQLRARLDGVPRELLTRAYAALYDGFRQRTLVLEHLMRYLDNSYVDRERQEGNGWFKLPDSDPPRHVSPQERRERERQALVDTYELPDTASYGDDQWKEALVRAEAGSLRRWRLDVLRPLLRDFADLIPSASAIADEDRAALEQLAKSMKGVGVKANDSQRQILDRLVTEK